MPNQNMQVPSIYLKMMMMLSIACTSLPFVVRAFDFCQRVLEGEELDLRAIAVTPRAVYLLTTNLYVYELPTSVYDDSNLKFNFNSADMKPKHLTQKWPKMAEHYLFQSLQTVWSTAFFLWDDGQDYLAVLNHTRGVAYGIGDASVQDISDYKMGRVSDIWSHLYLSGPYYNLSGVNNDPHYTSTLLVMGHFYKAAGHQPPFGLTDDAFHSPLCYSSSDNSQLYMVFDIPDPVDACAGQSAQWSVATGFVNSNRQIHMLAADRQVYIFSCDIMTFDERHTVDLIKRSFGDFFSCSKAGQSSAKPTEAASSSPSSTLDEEPSRLALILLIILITMAAIALWILLCVLSLPDCHWPTSRPPAKQSLRRPTVVKLLDSDAK